MTDRAGYPTTSAALLAAFYSDHYPYIVTLRDAAGQLCVSLAVVALVALVSLL